MARSNTNYYNLCHKWGEIGEDGYCDFHRPSRFWRMGGECIPPGKFIGRRGVVIRRNRFPGWSQKSWHKGPPADLKRIWVRKLRAAYRAELSRHREDPEMVDGKKYYSSLLWDWY